VLSLVRSTLADALVAAVVVEHAHASGTAAASAQLRDALGEAFGSSLQAQCVLRASRSSDAHICHGVHLLTLCLHTASDIDARPTVGGTLRCGERGASALRTLCTELARCSPGEPSIVALLAHIVCAREYGGVTALDFVLSAAADSPKGKAPSGAVPSGMAWVLIQCAAADAACAATLRATRDAVGARAGERVDTRGAQRENAQTSMLASMKQAQAAFAMNFDMSMSSSSSDDEESGEQHSASEESDASDEDAGTSTASASGAGEGCDAGAPVARGATHGGAGVRERAVAAIDDASAAPPALPEVCVMCHEEVSAEEIGTSSIGRFAHVQRSCLAFHAERRYGAALDRARLERADAGLRERALPRRERLRGEGGGAAAAHSGATAPNSILVTTCGHALHYQCFAEFSAAAATAGPSVSPNIDPRRGDLQCPLCKCVGNALLPIVPTRRSRAPSSPAPLATGESAVHAAHVRTDELLNWAASAILAEPPSPLSWGSPSPAAHSTHGARGARRGDAQRDGGGADEDAADALAPLGGGGVDAGEGLDVDAVIPVGDAIPAAPPYVAYFGADGSIPLRSTAFARAVAGDGRPEDEVSVIYIPLHVTRIMLTI
jgi:hypothetical protein